MKVLRLGHAMYLLTSKAGKRYLIDPFFAMNPGCPEEYTSPELFQSIDAVFLTHGHFDHTSGLGELKAANPDVLVVCQYDLGMILLQKGFTNFNLINFGGSVAFEDVTVSMVPAKHTSSYGETEGTPIYAGEPAGFVFDFAGDRTLYHSGDTTMMMDMKLIQEYYQPDVAILAASGQFTMGPKEAAYCVKNLLDVEFVIPSHTFPSKETTPRPEVLEGLLGAFPVVGMMQDRDGEFVELLEGYEKTRVVSLGYGEEYDFSK